MSRAIAFARSQTIDSIEVLRFAVVSTCGLALLAAGQFLPL